MWGSCAGDVKKVRGGGPATVARASRPPPRHRWISRSERSRATVAFGRVDTGDDALIRALRERAWHPGKRLDETRVPAAWLAERHGPDYKVVLAEVSRGFGTDGSLWLAWDAPEIDEYFADAPRGPLFAPASPALVEGGRGRVRAPVPGPAAPGVPGGRRRWFRSGRRAAVLPRREAAWARPDRRPAVGGRRAAGRSEGGAAFGMVPPRARRLHGAMARDPQCCGRSGAALRQRRVGSGVGETPHDAVHAAVPLREWLRRWTGGEPVHEFASASDDGALPDADRAEVGYWRSCPWADVHVPHASRADSSGRVPAAPRCRRRALNPTPPSQNCYLRHLLTCK